MQNIKTAIHEIAHATLHDTALAMPERPDRRTREVQAESVAYAMQLYLYSGAAHLEQSYPLLIAMAVIVVLVMVIYGVAVARTANREIGKLNYKPNS